MLLNNERRGPGCERVLITAEVGCRPGLGNRGRDLLGGWLTPTDIPDSEHEAFAIGHGDDTRG